jgi:multicomponent Na+:H+ antiporter subunit B
LVAAAGFIVYALPRGRESLLRLLVIKPESIAGSGVLLALSSGLLSLLAGQPFLTHQWILFSNGFAVGTPFLFDLGVYLAVVGAVLTFVGHYLEL